MRCGSWGYWLLVLAIVPVVLAVTLIAREYLVRKRRAKLVSSAINLLYSFLKSDTSSDSAEDQSEDSKPVDSALPH